MSGLRKATNRHQAFVCELLAEEARKSRRLKTLAMSIGLPIYESAEFRLPAQLAELTKQSDLIVCRSQWSLALRVADASSGRIEYRNLGLTFDECIRIARQMSHKPCLAVVTPYRVPERSGTFYAHGGHVTMELAFGPHTWLSKPAPSGALVARCSLDPYLGTMRYSVTDSDLRLTLFNSFQTVAAFLYSAGAPRLRDFIADAYAEFHWHKQFGYRFIECSFSRAWTGG